MTRLFRSEPTARARSLPGSTSAARDRYIDFLRALSITAVVIGHWLAVTIFVSGGRLQGRHVLTLLPEVHVLTWLFQVMGLFFVVGGYANAASWATALRSGTRYGQWLRGRSLRLLTPTTVFVATGTIVAAAARAVGLDADTVRLGAWVAAIPLWFLVVYPALVAMTPLLVAAHRRFGLAFCGVVIMIVVLGDAARFATGDSRSASANFVAVWLVAFTLGIAWRAGTLTRSRWLPWIAGSISAAALAAGTTIGPYPVSMVAVPGAPLQNTSPPTLALLALTVAQTALALGCASPVRRSLDRTAAIWTATVMVNRSIMTIYLWHMAAVVIAALVLHATNRIPDVSVGIGPWFALLPLWLATCAVALLLLLSLFHWAETLSIATRSANPGRPVTCVVIAGTALACGGVLFLTTTGLSGTGRAAVPVMALICYGVGMTLLAWVPRSSAP